MHDKPSGFPENQKYFMKTVTHHQETTKKIISAIQGKLGVKMKMLDFNDAEGEIDDLRIRIIVEEFGTSILLNDIDVSCVINGPDFINRLIKEIEHKITKVKENQEIIDNWTKFLQSYKNKKIKVFNQNIDFIEEDDQEINIKLSLKSLPALQEALQNFLTKL